MPQNHLYDVQKIFCSTNTLCFLAINNNMCSDMGLHIASLTNPTYLFVFSKVMRGMHDAKLC